jgi:hypothetical protein
MSADFTESEWELFISTIGIDSLPALDFQLDLSIPADPPIQLDTTSSHYTNSEVSSTALVPQVGQKESDVPPSNLPAEIRKK